MTLKFMAAFAAILFAFVSTAEARPQHYYRHHGGGACDGFQRCRCGTTAARYHGLPYSYKGFNLKLASEWPRAFPRTSFGIGVVGVKPHHVLTVVGGSTCSSATVHDDAGTYQRNVCRMIFVDAGRQSTTQEISAQPRRPHARQHRRLQHSEQRVAFYSGPGSLDAR